MNSSMKRQLSPQGHSSIKRKHRKLSAQKGHSTGTDQLRLHEAPYQDEGKKHESLLRSNTPIDKADTPLIKASRQGQTETVRQLLSLKAQVDLFQNEGATALTVASEGGHIDIVKLLLDHGANVNKPYNNGDKPLHHASSKGHRDIVKMLLKHGAPVDTLGNSGGKTPPVGRTRGVILLEHKASVNTSRNGIFEALVDYSGQTALIRASREGHTDSVQHLLKNEPRVDAADVFGATPLMVASGGGHEDTVKLLLEHKANVNTARYDGVTALMSASEKGNTGIVKLLLENGAVVNKAKNELVTLLIIAAQNGHQDIVEFLLERNPDIIEADVIYGNVALYEEYAYVHKQVVELLLKSKEPSSRTNRRRHSKRRRKATSHPRPHPQSHPSRHHSFDSKG